MPRAAFGLKENLGGTLAGASKMSDKEDAAAALRDSEMAAVQSDPERIIPAFVHLHECGGEIPALVGGKPPWNILNDEPMRAEEPGDPHEVEEEGAPLAPESGAAARDGEVLAWEPAADEVDPPEPLIYPPGLRRLESLGVRPRSATREPLPQYGAAEPVDLHLADDLPSGPLKAEVDAADARKDREGVHSVPG